MHNNKLNDDCRINTNLNLIESFYSWRRKLTVVDFLGIIRSPLTFVELSFWLHASNRYAKIWIVSLPFEVVGLPLNSKN